MQPNNEISPPAPEGPAQAIVRDLIAAGMTPQTISAALAGRVSARTIYRWLKGEHAPQKATDLRDLEALRDASAQ